MEHARLLIIDDDRELSSMLATYLTGQGYQVSVLDHGGGLDVAGLGFAEVRADGSVNVGDFQGNLRGPGGFVDITHKARKVLFCGSLTAGKGQKKFLERIKQVNFHGPTAVEKGQTVLYITERAVFRLTATGLELIELAPGVEIETVRAAMGFSIAVSPMLKPMDEHLFRD